MKYNDLNWSEAVDCGLPFAKCRLSLVYTSKFHTLQLVRNFCPNTVRNYSWKMNNYSFISTEARSQFRKLRHSNPNFDSQR